MGLYGAMTSLLRGIFHLLFSVKTEGFENLPEDEGFILVANHKSNFDAPFLASFMPFRLAFMSKEELFKVPLLGWFIKAVGAFPVKRGSGDIAAIKLALRILADKKNILMFPEGTRCKEEGKVLEGKQGAALIAYKAKTMIVPVGISGNYRFRSKMTIKMGKPISAAEYFTGKATSSDLQRFTDDEIMRSIVELSGAKYYGNSCCR